MDNTPSLVLALKSAARHSTSTSHCRRNSHHIVCRIPSPVPLLYFVYFEQCNKEGVAVWRAVDWGGCYATGPHQVPYSRRRDRAGEGTRPLAVLSILENTTFALKMTVAVSVLGTSIEKGTELFPFPYRLRPPPLLALELGGGGWEEGDGGFAWARLLRCVFEHIQHIQHIQEPASSPPGVSSRLENRHPARMREAHSEGCSRRAAARRAGGLGPIAGPLAEGGRAHRDQHPEATPPPPLVLIGHAASFTPY